ncbi:MAG: methyltransferase domain-containing protein, partial [Proteobacteria bacterium]|nr:methyltransferase domain-containing protein [Pseudomonadota bacterium]
MKFDPRIVEFLRCPVTKESVRLQDGWLVTESNARKYRVSDSGIPLFAEHFCSTDGKKQQFHYDKISKAYVENLTYPHTQEYMKYLDSAFLEHVEDISTSNVAEICCGRGEAFRLLKDRIMRGIGVDVSQSMLEVAAGDLSGQFVFLQGDATMLPLKDEIFDCVFMFGGIHHV